MYGMSRRNPLWRGSRSWLYGRGVCWRCPGKQDSASVDPSSAKGGQVDVYPGVDHQGDDEEDGNENGNEDSHPLLMLFDCDTTGFSISSDHITDILIASSVPLSQPTFSSLVRTPRNIPAAGK